MQRFTAVALSLLGLSAGAASAQESPAPTAAAVETAFSYCTVTDMGGHRIWASPIFEFRYSPADYVVYQTRLNDLATEFHNRVAGLGGAGDKSCYPPTTSRAELEAQRSEWRAVWTKRVLLWKSKWDEVAWTPQPWTPTAATAAPAISTKYVYCYVTDMDENLRKTVATQVFDAALAPPTDMAHYNELTRFQEEFSRQFIDGQRWSETAHPNCVAKDTVAEANKSRADYRNLFSGFNLTFTDVGWRPAPPPAKTEITAAAAAPAQAAAPTPVAAPAQTAAVAPSIAAVAPNTAPAQQNAQPGAVVWAEPSTTTLYAFCQNFGVEDRTLFRVFMTPVFELAKTEAQALAMASQQYAKDYKSATDPEKKLKSGSAVCFHATSRAEVEIHLGNVLALYATSNTKPEQTTWLPAGATPSTDPQGGPVQLYIACNMADIGTMRQWHTPAFTLPSADAASQLLVIRRLQTDFAAFIRTNQHPQRPTSPSCMGKIIKTEIEDISAMQATQFSQMKYTSSAVKWEPPL